MLENLTEKFGNIFKSLGKNSKLTEKNIQSGLRDIKFALLEADVNYKIVKDFVNHIKEKALGYDVVNKVTPTEQFIKLVYDELIDILGQNNDTLKFRSSGVSVFMMVGLNGAGKTTMTAKLAKELKKDHNVLVVGADIYRPAAKEQLKILSSQAKVEFFGGNDDDKPVKICRDAVKYAESNNFSVVLLDTAGRLQIDEALMKELSEIKKKTNPVEILFVADSMSGQNIVDVCKGFDERLSVSGVILTKFDSDARGGAALSIKKLTGKNIKYMGVGEKIDDLEIFYPDRIANRILGKGDIVTFVEKTQEAFDIDEAKKLQEKLAKNKFDFEDFLNQLLRIQKMGSMSKLIDLIPGLNKAARQEAIENAEVNQKIAIIRSMTKKEKKNFRIINPERRARIAKGSGTSIMDVNKLVNEFAQMNKMMKKMSKNPKKMLKLLEKMNIDENQLPTMF